MSQKKVNGSNLTCKVTYTVVTIKKPLLTLKSHHVSETVSGSRRVGICMEHLK